MSVREIPDSAYVAAVFKAVGDPLRLEILNVLSQGSYGVLELAQIFDVKQSGMSHHLKVLATVELVSTRREGNSIFYRRATLNLDDPLLEAKTAIFATVSNIQLTNSYAEQLALVHQQRSELSQLFFTENAEKFQQKSELIAEFPVYGGHVKEILEQTEFQQREYALEIGPGEGEFLDCLSENFNHITALDNSEAMLTLAKNRAEKNKLSNIEFVCADASALKKIKNKFDCAVMNMVLHHVPSPQQMFIEVAKALNTGGALIVCDLCEHTQEWVKENCGDLWLGFSSEDLTSWAEQAQLKEINHSFLALRNGFQIQLKQFVKI